VEESVQLYSLATASSEKVTLLPIVGLREGFLRMARREIDLTCAWYLPEIVKNAVNTLWSVLFNDVVSC
jgi:hypothetical protein